MAETTKTHLIDISAAVGRSLTEGAVDNVGQAVLSLLLVSERGVAANRDDCDELVDDVAEAWVNSTLVPFAPGKVLAGAPHVTDHEGAGGDDFLEGLDDGGMVGNNVLACEGPAASESRVASDFSLEHVVVQLVEGVEAVALGVIGDTEGVEVVEERLDNGLQLSKGLADADNGPDVEIQTASAQLVIHINVVVDKVGAVAVEDAYGLPEKGLIGGVGRVDVKSDASARLVVEELEGSLNNNGKGPGAATLQCPEEVGMSSFIDGPEIAIGSNDLELERSIGKEAIEVGQRTVATALDKTAGNTNSSTFTSEHQFGGVESMSLLKNLEGLDTSTEGDGRTLVAARGSVLVVELDVLEAVCVDHQGTPADAAAKKVVAGVTDNETQVVSAGKVDTGLDVIDSLGHDDHDGIVAQSAGVAGVCRGPAGVIGEVGPEASSRKLDSSRTQTHAVLVFLFSTSHSLSWSRKAYWNCSLFQLAVTSAHFAAS